jgi:hypothetical protein
MTPKPGKRGIESHSIVSPAPQPHVAQPFQAAMPAFLRAFLRAVLTSIFVWDEDNEPEETL